MERQLKRPAKDIAPTSREVEAQGRAYDFVLEALKRSPRDHATLLRRARRVYYGRKEKVVCHLATRKATRRRSSCVEHLHVRENAGDAMDCPAEPRAAKAAYRTCDVGTQAGCRVARASRKTCLEACRLAPRGKLGAWRKVPTPEGKGPITVERHAGETKASAKKTSGRGPRRGGGM